MLFSLEAIMDVYVGGGGRPLEGVAGGHNRRPLGIQARSGVLNHCRWWCSLARVQLVRGQQVTETRAGYNLRRSSRQTRRAATCDPLPEGTAG